MKNLSGNKLPVICFFDSGIGGLNLLYHSFKRYPCANYYYFADNYNVPYGDKPKEVLLRQTENIFKNIENLQPSVAVIACNTVTAVCAENLRRKFSFPIVGIQPAVKPAIRDGGNCTVIATPATANSSSVAELISRYGNGVAEVAACPYLASYIEENIFNIDKNKLSELLPVIKTDSIVLGCTHYIFIKEFLRLHYDCRIYDGVEGTVNRLFAQISNELLPAIGVSGGSVTFVGGDEEKNLRIFKVLKSQKGNITGK